MSNAPFVIQPELTAIAIAWSNQNFIADLVLPRSEVARKEFKYTSFNKEEGFTIPDTKVGRTSRPNEIEFGASETTDQVEDYGLEDAVPQADMDNAQGTRINPLARATSGLTNLIALDREKRVADLVFSAASYPTGNKVTLSGNAQWSDFTNSDPIDDITSAMDSMLATPTRMVIGQSAFTKLRQHPKIAKATLGNSGDVAIVARQAIAELFELQEVIVGQAWVNNAKKGQSASYTRLWGKHCALIYHNPEAVMSINGGVTFGLTAHQRVANADRLVWTRPDPNVGLYGGIRVRTGESVKEIIIAASAGYFIEDCVA
jgi:hypothetical protein